MERPTSRALPAAALAALLACAGEHAAAPPAAVDPNRPRYYALQVLEIRDAALNAHDVDGAAAAYAIDAVVIDAETNRVVLRGRDEIRLAHARFLELCPKARVEVRERSYQERGKIVNDVERVHCGRAPPIDGWVRYEIAEGAIVRVLKHSSPPFGG